RADRAAGAGRARAVPPRRPRQSHGGGRRRAPEPLPARTRAAARRAGGRSRGARRGRSDLPGGRSRSRMRAARRRAGRPPPVPLASGSLMRSAGRARAAVQGNRAAELVETLRGAPELVVYGREEEALDRVHLADRALARLTRRDALAAGVADGLGILVTGATT